MLELLDDYQSVEDSARRWPSRLRQPYVITAPASRESPPIIHCVSLPRERVHMHWCQKNHLRLLFDFSHWSKWMSWCTVAIRVWNGDLCFPPHFLLQTVLGNPKPVWIDFTGKSVSLKIHWCMEYKGALELVLLLFNFHCFQRCEPSYAVEFDCVPSVIDRPETLLTPWCKFYMLE